MRAAKERSRESSFNGPAAARPRPLAQRLAALIIAALIWTAPIAIGFILCLASPPLVEELRNLVFDQDQRALPRPYDPDLPVRVIDIDDGSLARLGQWPWPHQRLAELTDRLTAQGAAAIGFDILLAEKDRAAPENLLTQLPDIPERAALQHALATRGMLGTDRLAQAITKVPAALALVLTNDSPVRDMPVKAGFASTGDDPRLFIDHFRSAILPLPKLRDAAAGLGSINWTPDRDLIVRKVPLIEADGTGASARLVPSLDAELLRLAQRTGTIIVKSSNASGATGFGTASGVVAVKIGAIVIPTESDGMVRLRYTGAHKGRHISAWRVLAGEIPNSEIEGRIILIGSSAAALTDLRSTPLAAAVPGVDIHAELLEQILSGTHLARPDYAAGFEMLLLALGGIAAACLARFVKPILAATTLLALLALLGLAHFLAFSRAGLLFDPLMPAATWLLAHAVMTVAVYRRSERQRQFVRRAFSRYLAPALVARLADDPSQLELGGEAREVSVLFSDVRGFTGRCEHLSAEEVVNFLNRLHTPLTDTILAEAGTIDKYIGDGLMAFWNAPLDVANHAERACRAALAMQAALPGLNAEFAAEAAAAGKPREPVEIGIGINLGLVFVGNMGAEQRFDYSIVGDPVNIAARLETATKELCVPILVSETIVAAAKNFLFLPLGHIGLKGKSAATQVYALHTAAEDMEAEFLVFAELHRKALAAAEASAPEATARLAEVGAHPLAKAYAGFYTRLAQRLD